jgi:cytochrome c
MRAHHLLAFSLVFAAGGRSYSGGSNNSADGQGNGISFKNNVLPIFRKSCLPCHAEGSSNPSDLSLDSHERLLRGGKNGIVVVPGDARASILIQKLSATPPFGDRMPLRRRRDPRDLSLTPEEIRTLMEWIDEGAKDN